MAGLSGLTGPSGLSGIMGGGSYIGKVLGYGPIAYWVLNETAGGTAADQVNSPAQDGAYTGVSLANALGPDGVNYAPLFDGANDYVNVLTNTFKAAFSGTEGSVMLWVKVFNAGVWTDGTNRMTYRFAVDNNNQVQSARFGGANNRIYVDYEANNILERINVNGLSSTDWMCWIETWSVSGGNARAYLDGSEVANSPLAIGGVWAGGDLTISLIGAVSVVPGQPWYGWLAHCAVWTSALSPAAVLDLATI